jgi:hypothetical protein
MSEIVEQTPVETTPVEQPTEQTQESTPTEQPVTTQPEATTTEVPTEQAQPLESVKETLPEPFQLPVATEQAKDPLESLTLETVVDRFGSDKQALLKALGFDDFALGALDYYEKTGSLAEYAEVKSVDYTKVPDTDIMTRKLREQYAGHNLSEEELNLLVEDELQSRFKLDDLTYSERDVQLGKIRLKAEAAEYRKTLIERQQQFKAPERVVEEAKPQVPQPTYEQLVEQNRNMVMSDKTVQNFLQAKKVALGTGEPLNYEVPQAQEAMALFYDNNRYIHAVAQKNEKGEVLLQNGQPVWDYGKVQKLVTYLSNMEAFENALINHGKTLGKKAVVDEAENVVTNQSFGATKEPTDWATGLVGKILQQGG